MSKPPVLRKEKKVEALTEESKLEYPLNLGVVHVGLDPASHKFGVAVFSIDGKYIDSFTVQVSEGIIASMRLYFIRKKFIEIWEQRFGPNCVANLAVIEHLPSGNSSILQNAGGAILSSGKISAEMKFTDYISPPSWKFFARELGSMERDPKGISALKAIGWEYPLPKTEDEADAILLYLTSRWRKKLNIFLGDGKWLASWYQAKVFVPKKKREIKCKKVS